MNWKKGKNNDQEINEINTKFCLNKRFMQKIYNFFVHIKKRVAKRLLAIYKIKVNQFRKSS